MSLSPKLSLFSPAKINLFLHITGKRSDGYHNLQTVFRLLDWGDTLNFYSTDLSFNLAEPVSETNMPVSLNCEVPLTDRLEDNLIFKAANALIQWLKNNDNAQINSQPVKSANNLPVVRIDLNKVLPTGAGLGGGSSNAATTLLALTKIWGLSIDTATLIKIGAGIGADVPIFLFGKDAIAEGIGEVLTPIDLPEQTYLILNPDAHASTQALFTHPELNRSSITLNHSEIIEQTDRFTNKLHSPFCNVFEPVVIQMVSEVKTALDYLKSLECITQTNARMTGTGSSVFLPIPNAKKNDVMHHIENIDTPPCHYVITCSLSTA